MSSARTILHALLLASSAMAVTMVGSPKLINVIPDKVKGFGFGGAGNVPDGKFLSYRADPNDRSKGFIINTTPNFFMTSPTSFLEDVTGPRDISGADKQNPLPGDASNDGSNYIILEPTISIPSAEKTGMRGNGTLYDQGSWWIFGAYRYSETSQPGADPDAMIGFEHNEDYFGDSKCTYKSIGVRYSNDSGKSWTRSVPIITTGVEMPACDMSKQFTGGGDFASAWDHIKKQWTIFGPENSLAMKISTDAKASPGSWIRINPANNTTPGPGFIGKTSQAEEDAMAHGDLTSIPGSSPSIIWDQKNSVWHMVYGKWGNGIVYTKSADLQRWDRPMMLIDSDAQPNSKYPTLIGDEGDTVTTDGTARLYFGADNNVTPNFRALWVVTLDFGDSGAASNDTSPTSPDMPTVTGGDTTSSSAPATVGGSDTSPGSAAGATGNDDNTCSNDDNDPPEPSSSVIAPSNTERRSRVRSNHYRNRYQ